MITAVDVQRVARTGQPHPVRTGDDPLNLDIEYVVKHTTGKDWDGDLYELGASAAYELARQFNETHDLTPGPRLMELVEA